MLPLLLPTMLPLLLLVSSPPVSGHGGMVWPPIWQDGFYTPLEEQYSYLVYSDPLVKDPNSGRDIKSVKSFLTDQAYTGGQGDDFLGVGPVGEINNKKVRKADQCRKSCRADRNPWAFPGKAPNFGGGCGIFGGNPFGCPNYQDSRPPGSRCGQDAPLGRGPRGTSSFGTSALEIDFPQAAVTSWPLGSVQEVTWLGKGPHWGGYTYRLCKLPAEGKVGLTEECFAKNILEFATNHTMWRESGEQNLGVWNKFEQRDRTEGTYPEGSAWRPVGVLGDAASGDNGGLFRKDEVVVPADLAEGEYVLSFRWDIAGGPQVWDSCAFVSLMADSTRADYTSAEYEELEEQRFQA